MIKDAFGAEVHIGDVLVYSASTRNGNHGMRFGKVIDIRLPNKRSSHERLIVRTYFAERKKYSWVSLNKETIPARVRNMPVYGNCLIINVLPDHIERLINS